MAVEVFIARYLPVKPLRYHRILRSLCGQSCAQAELVCWFRTACHEKNQQARTTGIGLQTAMRV